MKSKAYLYLLLAFGLFGHSACRRDCHDNCNPKCENYCIDITNPVCCNYDSCHGKMPTNAEFKVQKLRPHASIFGPDFHDCDTVIQGNVKFSAEFGEGDSYYWRLGSTVRTDSVFYLTFGAFQASDTLNWWTPIPVMLVVQKNQPNRDCFPQDDGRDTIIKNIVWADHRKAAFVGIWEGAYTDTPTEIHRIVIKPNFPEHYSNHGYIIENLYNKGFVLEDIVHWESYTQFHGEGHYKVPDGPFTTNWRVARISVVCDNINNRIEMTLSEKNLAYIWIPRTFKGVRIF